MRLLRKARNDIGVVRNDNTVAPRDDRRDVRDDWLFVI